MERRVRSLINNSAAAALAVGAVGMQHESEWPPLRLLDPPRSLRTWATHNYSIIIIIILVIIMVIVGASRPIGDDVAQRLYVSFDK